MNKPNSKYQHVYAVVRLDEYVGSVISPNHVTVTKVFLDENSADLEVKRLNELNQGKGCQYFVSITRLVSTP